MSLQARITALAQAVAADVKSLAAAVAAHIAAGDPHPQYTTTAEASATAPVQSVAGRAGAVVLAKADVGLGNVDNTTDATKPISTATQTALNGKASLTGAGTSGTWPVSISGAATVPTLSGYLSGYVLEDANAGATGGYTVRYVASGATNKPAGTDGNLQTIAYSGVWATQIYSDWRTNEWHVRAQSDGVWTEWRNLLHSGNFGTYAPTLTGVGASGTWSINAATATKLATARAINGVNFDGTANITVADATKLPLSGGTLTGAISFAGAQTWPTFNQSTTGNAATATKLATARTINGVAFNGTANITVADSTKLPLAGGTMTGAISFAAGQVWPTFNQNTTGNAATATNVAWSGVTGKPAVIAAGATAADARVAIGAGTSNLELGTSSSTALAGNTPFQSPLVSGTNIKSLGGVSLLGSGDLAIGDSLEVGDTVLTARALSAPEYLQLNGGLYLQSSYSALFAELGILSDSPSAFYAVARTLPTDAGWISVAYGNGVFVAVSEGGPHAASSVDGITWTLRTQPSDTSPYCVVFGNGVFVAPGGYSSNKVNTSSDGITWTQRTLSSSGYWNSIAFGSGVFVTVSWLATTTKALTSTDGISWTDRTMPSSAAWKAVAYGGGQFVAIANNTNKAASSPDGITWTARTLPSSAKWESIAYGNGTFVAIAYDASGSTVAASSTNGTAWTARTLPSSSSWKSISFGGGVFLVTANNSDKAATSADGITWTARTMSANANWFGSTYGLDKFVAVASYAVAANIYQASYDIGTLFYVPSVPAPDGLNYYIKAT